MNEEDEAFNEIERRAKQRMEAVKAAMRGEDDDIQDYKRPWVGLTRMELIKCGVLPYGMSYELYQTIEKKLKEKNQ